MAVRYEWCVETIDNEHGDVLALDHAESLRDALQGALRCPPEEGEHYVLVLVREVWDEFDGFRVDRGWAYVGGEERRLPEEFSGGLDEARVPKRFHQEYAREIARANVSLERAGIRMT